ncbi:hypothetical protein CIL03_02185 [Virgibacillus indicus]|uniref:Uncharacterized protein n=1 Tax=Virgibacillus indicus TaxID=2024554 RepID=A0A265NDV5_9BACI|nr:hypothetical protein CIL03_02185 [Virgibacillus indicus]
MRFFIVITSIITVISVIYKWRYRIMNTVLAVSFLRRMAVAVSMKMPAIRAKILPGFFNNQSA